MTRQEVVICGAVGVAYLVYRIYQNEQANVAAATAGEVQNAGAPASAAANESGQYPSAGGGIPEAGSGYYGLAGASGVPGGSATEAYDEADMLSIESENPTPANVVGLPSETALVDVLNPAKYVQYMEDFVV